MLRKRRCRACPTFPLTRHPRRATVSPRGERTQPAKGQNEMHSDDEIIQRMFEVLPPFRGTGKCMMDVQPIPLAPPYDPANDWRGPYTGGEPVVVAYHS